MKRRASTKPKQRAPMVFSIVLTLLFVGVVWLSARIGATYYHIDTQSAAPIVPSSAWQNFTDSVAHHGSSTIGLLLLQIIVILTVARLVGVLFRHIGQPQVIGEIVAGILLGPSILGALWPEAFAFLFPEESIAFIEILSEFGLILFMFTIGMELRPAEIKSQFRKAFIISQSGIFIPFILGMLLTIFLYDSTSFHVPYLPLALFMGIAMSITAFPVLARIIQERGMSRTHLGSLALNTAAVADIAAWLLLAAVMAIIQSGSITSALFNFLFLILYIALFFGVIRPLFALVGSVYNKNELVNKTLVAVIFILVLVSAYLTNLLSMHALFGAFMVGLIMPDDNKFRHVITEKVEDVSLSIFLPLFFVSSGLRTELGLINSGALWALLTLLVVVAIVGKVGGTYIAARLCNISKKESLYLGAFMNTRGLMELVVLKIGLDLGVLPPVIFVLLVMMTLITTLMTQPLLQLMNALFKRRTKNKPKASAISHTKPILISFGRPDTGSLLLQLSKQIMEPPLLDEGVALLHTTINSELSLTDEEEYYEENFSPLLHEGERLGIDMEAIYHVTDDVLHTIMDEANREGNQFLLVGAGLELSGSDEDRKIIKQHKQLERKWKRFSISHPTSILRAGELFNDKTRRFFREADCSVGVFVNRDFTKPGKILVGVGEEETFSLLPFAQRMAETNGGSVTLFRFSALLDSEQAPLPAVYAESRGLGIPVEIGDEFPDKSDFLFISYATWQRLTSECPQLLEHLPSTLIMELRNSEDTLRIPATSIPFE